MASLKIKYVKWLTLPSVVLFYSSFNLPLLTHHILERHYHFTIQSLENSTYLRIIAPFFPLSFFIAALSLTLSHTPFNEC